MKAETDSRQKLDLGIAKDKMPRHVAIILDGNRRFAKFLNLDPWKGHEYGEKKVEKLLEWCYEVDIKELTLYAFSMQNFNRTKPEYDFLVKLFKEAFTNLLKNKKLDEYDVRIRFIGRINLFPKDVYDLMNEIMEKTKDRKTYTVNLAMAYGGREEITDGIKALVKDVKSGIVKEEDINEDLFSRYLYMNSAPDLIIRTSGEQRTSNFLPWQGIYSEWIFLKKYWPEFEKEDLIECIKEYSKRDIRKGK
jgi:tritrans,polycis-undecaprenyl-diphosphate synthase [geranylgeranyl-diphosphate specific]